MADDLKQQLDDAQTALDGETAEVQEDSQKMPESEPAEINEEGAKDSENTDVKAMPEETTEEATSPAEEPQEEITEAPSEEAPSVETLTDDATEDSVIDETPVVDENPNARWYVVHTYSGHENRVAQTLKQRVEAEHLEGKIIEVLVPTQEKIEIRGGKKEQVKEKIFPGYLLVKMVLDDDSWLAVRTTQGVTSFIGMSNKPTPIPASEVQSILKFMQQGGQPTYKQAFNDGDTVKIVDGPFTEFIGKIDNVDKDRGKVRVLVSIFGRETPVELDFLQVQKL